MVRFGAGGGHFAYHADGLGSITTLTDLNGTPVRSYTYDSFGRLVAQTGTVTNPYTYTGRELDPESGLYYYRARYYDPLTGRFLQEDPFKGMLQLPLSFNPYPYVLGNPLRFTDPTGQVAPLLLREQRGQAKGSSRSLTELPCYGSLAPCRVPSASNSPVPRTM
jgi:RHS repeat-associated protein